MKALGSFRGTIEDAGVGVSSGGFPQFVAKLHVEEMYDEEQKEWAPWEEFDWTPDQVNDRTIFAYEILFGQKGATLSNDQVKKVTSWNGESFAGLAAMDHKGTKVQWRNETNTYEGNTTVQVAWLDEYDATPGGSVKKIDAKALADLDAKFADMLAKKDAAPAKGKRTRKPAADAPAEAPAEETVPETPAEESTKPKRGRRSKAKIAADKAAKEETAPPAEETAPPVEETAPPAEDASDLLLDNAGPCTKQEAWTDVNKGKRADVDVKELTAVWQKILKAVAPGKAADAITDEDWSAVRAGVLDEIGA
jgi:hypothetical protein